jgi:hypothetical protein
VGKLPRRAAMRIEEIFRAELGRLLGDIEGEVFCRACRSPAARFDYAVRGEAMYPACLATGALVVAGATSVG